MRTILHTIDTTGPGGAETVFIDLATRLPLEIADNDSSDAYRSIIVIRGKGWVYEELCRRGIEPILLDAKGSFNWRYLKKLMALIRHENVDLIQSHLLGSNVYCSLAGLLTRRPVVATFHGVVDVGVRERLKWLKFGAINMGAKAIIAVSENLRKNIVNRTALKSNNTRVIYNGIDTADFARPRTDVIRRQFGWSEDDMVIGSLGNIRSAKAYDVLLRAAALLNNHSPNFRFVITGQGKGKLYDDLIKLKAELGLDDVVHFLGFNDDPAEFLSNLDLFLLSSSSEGFSIATIQAMAAGLPVIVTRSGGPEEIVTHRENGWMVEPGRPGEIAEAVKLLATHRELSKGLAEKGQKHVIETFDIHAMLDAYKIVYNELLKIN